MEQIKVLIADDHPLIRQGLVKVINLDKEISVVGEAVDGEDAINKAKELQPNVILMDLNMPKIDGLEAIKTIREAQPDVKLIALTVDDSQQKVLEVIKSGISGYILKDINADALALIIKTVNAGETVIDPKIMLMLIRELDFVTWDSLDYLSVNQNICVQLSQREIEILKYVVKGSHNKEIAQKLYISEKTVKNHLTNIFDKLQVKDRTQAALMAIKMKLVSL